MNHDHTHKHRLRRCIDWMGFFDCCFPPSTTRVGTRVQLHGLTSRVEFNERTGIVQHWVDDSATSTADGGRWSVLMDHTRTQIAVKPENLRPIGALPGLFSALYTPRSSPHTPNTPHTVHPAPGRHGSENLSTHTHIGEMVVLQSLSVARQLNGIAGIVIGRSKERFLILPFTKHTQLQSSRGSIVSVKPQNFFRLDGVAVLPSEHDHNIVPGDVVRVEGLASLQDLNGKLGIALDALGTGRFKVIIWHKAEPKEYAMRPRNLHLVYRTAESGAGGWATPGQARGANVGAALHAHADTGMEAEVVEVEATPVDGEEAASAAGVERVASSSSSWAWADIPIAQASVIQ